MTEARGVEDCIAALAFIGDLSMGQPIDHSPRVARLAVSLARAAGCGDEVASRVARVAMLRWSGCVGNAAEVAQLLQDDVLGRAAMMAHRHEDMTLREGVTLDHPAIQAAASVHCEVAVLIAGMLGLEDGTAPALACVLERWDGSGRPLALKGDAVPEVAQWVSLAGDLEVFERVHGFPRALAMLADLAGRTHSAANVALAAAHAAQWFEALREAPAAPPRTPGQEPMAADAFTLLGQVQDLKIPWLAGQSQRVAALSVEVGRAAGLPEDQLARLDAAARLSGLGRSAVPNAIWDREGPLGTADRERVRLCPYWLHRLGAHVPSLRREAEWASLAHERIDGSGYFRGLGGESLPVPSQVLAIVVCWLAMTEPRPWRPALAPATARESLQQDVQAGRFDEAVWRALMQAVDPDAPARKPVVTAPRGGLSARELDVLQLIARGASNKEAAQSLGISPATVRTHVESIFRKLGCNSRAACALKASQAGLL